MKYPAQFIALHMYEKQLRVGVPVFDVLNIQPQFMALDMYETQLR